MKRRLLAAAIAGILTFSHAGAALAAENPAAAGTAEISAAEEYGEAASEIGADQAALETADGEASAESADGQADIESPAEGKETETAGETKKAEGAEPEETPGTQVSDGTAEADHTEEEPGAAEADSPEEEFGTAEANSPKEEPGAAEADSPKEEPGTAEADSPKEESGTAEAGITEETTKAAAASDAAAMAQEEFDREPYIERQFGFGDRSLLPGWTQWIDRLQHCYVENAEYPEGRHFDMIVTDISLEDIEGENVVSISYSGENGWDLRAQNGGICKVTVTYKDWDGSQNTEEFRLYVGSDVYEVDLWTDSGSDRILPGGEAAMTAEARHEVYDFASREYHSCSEEEMEGITYEWRLEFFDENVREELGDLITLTPDEEDPRKAVIRFGDIPDGWNHIDANVIVTISENGEAKAENNHWIFMDRHYYELWPTRIDGNIDVGQETVFTPQVREYPADNADGYDILPAEQVEYEVEIYDDKAYTVTPGDGGTYVVKRLREYDTSFRIRAFVKNEDGNPEEVDNREYWLNRKNYDFWYDISGNDQIFSDGLRTFGFNLDRLDGVEYELVPEVGRGEWNEESGFENPLEEGDGWGYDSSAHQITFSGPALYEKGIDRIETRISLRIGGEEVASEWHGFDVREAWYDFHGEFEDEVLFVDDEWFISAENNVYLCTTDFPDGCDARYEIRDLTFEAEEDEFDSRDPITLERTEDGWKVRAVRGGEAKMHADIKVYATDGETNTLYEQERDFKLIVGGQRINMHLFTSTGSDRLLPGETIRLTPKIYAEEYDWSTGERRDIDTSEYEVRYEVRCDRISEQLVDDRFGGDYEAAAARGVLWDYEEDPEDRSILLKAIDPEADEVELNVEARLIDPETGEERAGAGRTIFVNSTIMELALRKADGVTPLDWEEMIPPGAEVEMVPVLMRNASDGNSSPAHDHTDVAYRLEWYEGGGEDDPATFEITDKDGNALVPSQDVTADAFPLTVKRMVDWDTNLSICGKWTDDQGNEQEVWRDLYCAGVEYTDGFIVSNNRGDKRFTWYYSDESIDVRPDRGKLDALAAQGYPVEVSLEIGVPIDGEVQPIRNYVIDEEGRRGEEIGLYDLGGIFDQQNGLQVGGEAVGDLFYMLRYQRGEWPTDFARVQLRLTAELNGVTLADEFINVNISNPFLEIVNVKDKMGVGTEQVFANGETRLYIEAPGHDSGINAYYETGDFYDVTITNIELEEEEDSRYIAISSDGGDWKLTALAESDHYVPLTVTFKDGPEGYDTCRMDIQVSGNIFTAELRDAAGNATDNVRILMQQEGTLTPLVTHIEYREEDGEIRETTTEVPARADGQGGFSYEISYDYYDDRTISIDNTTGVITPLRTGYTDVDVTVTIFDENGEWVDEIWFPISVEVGVSRAELTNAEDVPFYVAPGEEFTAEQIGAKIAPVLTVYSMKEPGGKVYPVDEYSLESVWFGDDELTLSEGSEGRFSRLSVREDALSGVTGTKEVMLALRGREANGNEAIVGVRVIIHNHNWTNWTTTKAPTVFAEGVSTGTCTVCGETTTKPIAKLTPTIKVNWTAATIAKTKAKTAVVTYAAGDSVASAASSNSKVATAKVSGKNVVVTAGTTAGTAKITVKLKSGKSAVLTITVPKVNCTGITAKTSYTVTTLSTINMGVKLNPVYSDNTITYKSANTKIATVTSKGVVKGIKVGKTTITITTSNKKTKKVTIVVKQGTTGLTTSKTAYTVVVGKTVAIGAKKTPSTSADAIKYTSANKGVATVTSTGVIKGIKAGKTTITVKSGTKTKKVTVTVKPKTTSITTLKTAYTVGVKKTVSLGAKKVPSTSGEAITYTSSNTAIAKVSTAGVVTGIKKGKVTITIKSGAITRKVTVTVK